IFENHLAIDLVTTQKLSLRSRGVPPVQLGAATTQDSVTRSRVSALNGPAEAARPIDRCVGVYVLDNKSGRVEAFVAPAVLLATGGCGRGYLYTTHPDIAPGDGL